MCVSLHGWRGMLQKLLSCAAPRKGKGLANSLSLLVYRLMSETQTVPQHHAHGLKAGSCPKAADMAIWLQLAFYLRILRVLYIKGKIVVSLCMLNTEQRSVTLVPLPTHSLLCTGLDTCFVPLLPPKETTSISNTEALNFQLGYRPMAADVVAFSEVWPSQRSRSVTSSVMP